VRVKRSSLGLALAAWLVLAGSAHAAGAPRGQLALSKTTTSLGTDFKRYQQRVDGVPVLGGEVVVTNAPGEAADLKLDRSRRGLRAPGRATVTRVEAIAAARRATRASDLRAAPRAGRAILPTARGGRLVWRVLLASGRPLASFEALVDARSGAIVRLRDRLKHDTGKAAVFIPNPVVAQGSRAGLDDDDDGDSPLLTSLRTPVALERLKSGTSCLKGRWVHAKLPSGEVCKPNADFTSVTRADDDFEALMAYVHVDRARAYLESLGFPSLLNRSQRVLANGTSADDAFYDTEDKSITLGEGGVDDGEDGDVIVHEYGHAVQDAQVRDFGESPQGAAMGEGFSDYLQAALDAQRAPSATFNPCVAEWDAIDTEDSDSGQCLTRTDTDFTASQGGPGTGCNTEPHCAGTAWSGALWRVRGLIGGPTADRLVVQSHYPLTKTADFVDGSIALILTDRALYGGIHEQVLRDVLNAHGLLDRKWPVLKLSGKLPRIGTVRRTRRFRMTVELSEPGTVRLSALLERASKSAKPVVRARKMTFTREGRRRVTFRLTRAGLRLLSTRRSAVLRIRAKATFRSGRTLPAVQTRRRLR